MFLQLLYGGTDSLEPYSSETKEQQLKGKVLNVAQDIVYGVSGGKKWTPKHTGLGSTLHRLTRSRQIVDLFHKAGHIISYEQILQLDTALAESTLETMDPETGAVIPHGLVPGRFTCYSADNVDINEGTLDAKNTFHATQMAAWQRGPPPEPLLDTLKPSKDCKLTVPEAMDTLMPAQAIEGKLKPVFSKDIDKTWYTDKNVISAKKANATDLAYQIRRQQADVKASWTAFNQTLIAIDLEMTTVGYIPIIQAPADEIDTLNAVVNRCMYISAQLGQEYTVITVTKPSIQNSWN